MMKTTLKKLIGKNHGTKQRLALEDAVNKQTEDDEEDSGQTEVWRLGNGRCNRCKMI
jgi:hypothetical protein